MSPLKCVYRACVFLAGCLVTSAGQASLLISEVLYDAPGLDNGQVFIELYGPPGLDLTGYNLQGINGANGLGYLNLNLSGFLPADGVFVLADDVGDGSTLVANADLILNFDFQNGPDSILLRFGSTLLDALGYEVFGAAEIFAGEGQPAPDTAAGQSLARIFADVDTGNNALDFQLLAAPTPGVVQLAPTQKVHAVSAPMATLLYVTGLGCCFLVRRRADTPRCVQA